jgi:hypothetical protein
MHTIVCEHFMIVLLVLLLTSVFIVANVDQLLSSMLLFSSLSNISLTAFIDSYAHFITRVVKKLYAALLCCLVVISSRS